MIRKTALLSVILGASLALPLAAQQALIGRWEGAIVLLAAEQEIDVEVDFSQAGEQVKGQLSFPMTADGVHDVESLSLQGNHVTFSVRDAQGVTSTFEGDISQDRAIVQGTFTESGKPMPFTLRRAKASPARQTPPTVRLSGDGIPLKASFNNDVGKTRLLLLLNLGSFSSKMALRVVERYVVEQIENPNLQVYIVWMGREVPNVEQVLQQSVMLATDPRVTHFWSTDLSLAKIFEPMLASYQPASSPCLLFAPGKAWTDTAPMPDKVRQSAKVGAKTQVSPGQKLNGVELALDVQLLLGTKGDARSGFK